MDLTTALQTFQEAMFSGNSGTRNLLGLNDYVDYIIRYAYLLASILMVLLVGSKVITYFMNPSGNMDPYILVKPVLILLALYLYQPLVELLLVKPTNLIADITAEGARFVTNAGNGAEFDEYYNNSITNIQDTNPDGSDGDGIYDVLQVNPLLELFHLLIYFVASIVAGYILIKQLIFKGIYFVLGVFVLPMSLIPGNYEILKKWFFGFLSVLLWIPILKIVQTIFILINNNTGNGFEQILLSIALQVAMIVFVLKVPKFANFLISGSGDADGEGYLTSSIRELYYSRKGRSAYNRSRGG